MKIIICGSMTASKEMVEAEKELQKLGHEVILPEFTHDYAKMKKHEEMHSEAVGNKVHYDLIRGYYQTIKSGDTVLVVNPERKGIHGYIGGNSFLEIGYAHALDKVVFVLHPLPTESPYLDELKAIDPMIIDGDYSLIK